MVVANPSIRRRSPGARPTLMASAPFGAQMIGCDLEELTRGQLRWNIRWAVGIHADQVIFLRAFLQAPAPVADDDVQVGQVHAKIFRPTCTIFGSISKPSMVTFGKTAAAWRAVVPAASPTMAMRVISAGWRCRIEERGHQELLPGPAVFERVADCILSGRPAHRSSAGNASR